MIDFFKDYSKYMIGITLYDGRRVCIRGWYCDKRESVGIPQGYYAYEFRSGDIDDEYIKTIEPSVVLNHSGTFICKKIIPFGMNSNPMVFRINYGREW